MMGRLGASTKLGVEGLHVAVRVEPSMANAVPTPSPPPRTLQ